MNFFSLIICTYNRPKSLSRLLRSISHQSFIPTEVVIVDSSDFLTRLDIKTANLNIKYFRVSTEHRGLTRQRNYGISKVDKNSEIICFLDDDLILNEDFFYHIYKTFNENKNTIGVGGYISNEINWKKNENWPDGISYKKFQFDGHIRKLPLRFAIRKLLGLLPDKSPGYMPNFSHGFSTSFLPPSGKTYEVEMLMGGISAYRKSLFERISFSEYFQGYGLYEDAEFSIRASKIGKLLLCTRATVKHLHDYRGRPSHFRYGKMVVRNGYFVWRVKNPRPSVMHRLKWYLITILLIKLRVFNIFMGSKRQAALSESFGRLSGLLSLILNRPS